MEEFIRASSGNAYEDLGYPDSESMKMKADIVNAISKLMTEKISPSKPYQNSQVSRKAGFPKSSMVNFVE